MGARIRGSADRLHVDPTNPLGVCTGVPQPGIPLIEYPRDLDQLHWVDPAERLPREGVPVWACFRSGPNVGKVELVRLHAQRANGADQKWFVYTWDTHYHRPVPIALWAPLVAPLAPENP